MSEAEDREFEDLLEFLKGTRGFDFSAYKRTSLMRRMKKRLETLSLPGFGDYTDYLQVHPEEFSRLFDTILINVTSFFRDETAWAAIADQIIPQIVAQPDGRPIRVWSAGCASGEEAYTAAMLFAESLGVEQFRDRVKIYATDADDGALNEARTAVYTARQVQAVPSDLLEKYFEEENGHYTFNRDVRRSVIFGRHDLVQDAPISHVSLLICRNTLMYFNAETQARILARFHFALGDAGVLFLGKAEMLLARATQLYRPIDVRRRIFGKIVKEGWRERLAIMSDANQNHLFAAPGAILQPFPLALEVAPDPMLVLDGAANLVFVNDAARGLLRLSAADIGRAVVPQEASPWPLDIRSLAEQCLSQRRRIVVEQLAWPVTGGETRYFEVRVSPLNDNGEGIVGVLIALKETTRLRELEKQLNRSHQELETASEELQSTNEELETTNEELQSTVEELETTNEELQSTNEELETMNEELQSTNEELQTINDELRERSDELNRANAFLESILSGVPGGVIVVDRNLQVLAWNHRSEDLWGVRSDEVKGQSLMALDIGLPVAELGHAIRVCLSGEQDMAQLTVAATNRRGRVIQCRVTCTPLKGSAAETRGVILLIEDVAGEAEPRVNTVTH